MGVGGKRGGGNGEGRGVCGGVLGSDRVGLDAAVWRLVLVWVLECFGVVGWERGASKGGFASGIVL